MPFKHLLILIFIVIGFSACQDMQVRLETKNDKIPNDWFYTQRALPYQWIPTKKIKAAISDFKNDKQSKSLIEGYDAPWESVGPTNVGGRITDLEMFSENQQTILAGSASGGIFKSDDQGNTWRNVFDEAMSLSIGDMAIAPSDQNVIYAGTGEANAGGGSLAYDGLGVYRSDDQGESWSHVGLEQAGSIGRVQVNPNDENNVFVASMGRLFGNNEDRGVFKTSDGGDNWQNVFSLTDSTGAIDLVIHPTDGNIIYTAMWERVRRPSFRNYGGLSSGIYRSTDNGNNWIELTNGLPGPQTLNGRIGLAISQSNPEILYALYTDEIGFISGIYKTIDGGDSWEERSINGIENVSFNWWFGKIFVDPNDSERLWVTALNMYESTNGAGSWRLKFVDVHVDQHALVIHPQNPDLVIAGNDGGVFVSQNGGNAYQKSPNLPNIQFYTCEIDESNPERLYGGAQDNGTIRTLTGANDDWSELFGGDGFRVIVDPTDSQIIYAEAQRGFIVRTTNGGNTFFDGRIGLSGSFNWHTPIAMNAQNTNILYTGAQRVFKTTNRAARWSVISPDLTNGPYEGNLNYGTVTAIEVAPNNSDLIYAGTDDGNIWITQDGGSNWNKISDDLPLRWVTSIESDPFDEKRVYVTLSGYRYDEGDGQVFASFDNGATWTNLSSSLPDMPLNKILLDPTNEGTMFLGSDLGAYVSVNGGADWEILGTDFPMVPVTDLDMHVGENFLVAATYGRSMFKYSLPLNTSNENLNSKVAFNIYPNPASDYLTITSSEISFDRIEIFDLNGKKVLNQNSSSNIDISSLNNGIYIIKVFNDSKSIYHSRFVKI